MLADTDLDRLDNEGQQLAIKGLSLLAESGLWEATVAMNESRIVLSKESPKVIAKKVVKFREYKAVIDTLDSLGRRFIKEQ